MSDIESVGSMLAKINGAKAFLAEAKGFGEILRVRDMAVAAKAWASARGVDEEQLFQ